MKPFSKPYRSWRSALYVAKAIANNQLTAGPQVDQFVKAFREKVVKNHAELIIPTASGSAAIKLAMTIINEEVGRKTYLPKAHQKVSVKVLRSNYWEGIRHAIEQSGGVVVNKSDSLATVNYHVEQYGFPCLPYASPAYRILDCAQSLIPSTDIPYDFYIWSFHGSKSISCGEGGALGINMGRFQRLSLDRVMEIAGYRQGGDGYKVNNFRMSELSAAYLRGQLARFDRIQSMRTALFGQYNQYFKQHDEAPKVPWCYPIRVKSIYSRNAMEQLRKEYELRSGFEPDILLLPIHDGISKKDIYTLYMALRPIMID